MNWSFKAVPPTDLHFYSAITFIVLPSNSRFNLLNFMQSNFHPDWIQDLVNVQLWQPSAVHTDPIQIRTHMTHSLYMQLTLAWCSRLIKELSNTTDASAFSIFSNHTLPTRALHGAGLHSWGGSVQALKLEMWGHYSGQIHGMTMQTTSSDRKIAYTTHICIIFYI